MRRWSLLGVGIVSAVLIAGCGTVDTGPEPEPLTPEEEARQEEQLRREAEGAEGRSHREQSREEKAAEP